MSYDNKIHISPQHIHSMLAQVYFQKQNSCWSASTPCIWFKERNMVLLWELYGRVKTMF